MLFVGCSFSFLKREIWNLKLGARRILGHCIGLPVAWVSWLVCNWQSWWRKHVKAKGG